MDANTLGRSVRRLEDFRFLTGRGRYVDDVAVPGAAYLHVLRSPHAHAAIEGIDISAARAAPGVLGVFAEADLRAEGLGPLPCVAQVADRRPTDRAAALCAGARAGPACGRSGRVRCRRDPRAGARRVRADHGRIPPSRRGRPTRRRLCSPEHRDLGRGARQSLLSLSARRQRSGRCRLRQSGADRGDCARQQPACRRRRSSRAPRSAAMTRPPAASICC